ncbi:MAG: cytochrome c oxidase assembly protein [Actinomycetes bacterium]
MRVELNPILILLLGLTAGLYQRAIIRLRRRGYRVPRLQQAFWWTGVSLLAIGLLGPPAAYSEELFWAHMAEHLLIADIAAPFLLAGIRTPVYLFMPPREILVLVARNGTLRSIGSFLTRPLVALPLSIFVLYAWHIGPLFALATSEPAIHALQHQSFLVANLLLWWPALEPSKRPMPGGLWKIGYLLAARMGSVFMGMVFLISRRPFYSDLYGETAPRFGMTALADQQMGAGLMMITDVVMMMTILGVFFVAAAADGERKDAARTAAMQAGQDRT